MLVALDALLVDRGFAVRLSEVPASLGAVVEVLVSADLPLAGGSPFVGELVFGNFVVCDRGFEVGVVGELDLEALVVGVWGLGVVGVADAPVVGEAGPWVGFGTRTPAQ